FRQLLATQPVSVLDTEKALTRVPGVGPFIAKNVSEAIHEAGLALDWESWDVDGCGMSSNTNY
ncbi:unnamed protein product, partial [Effrenium voratum]